MEAKIRHTAITFDDGYRDNVIHALPVLGKCGLNATFFIISGLVDRTETPWYDALGRALADPAVRTELALFLKEHEQTREEVIDPRVRETPKAIVHLAKLMGPDERLALVEMAKERSSVTRDLFED